MSQQRWYAFLGALFGLVFPIAGVVLLAVESGHGLTADGLRAAFGSKLLLIVCTAPLFLGGFAAFAGHKHDHGMALEAARREALLKTATELFTAAQSLLSTVSSFSSMTAETAASVRETTATMGQLGQTATRTALTAETVVGLAREGERTSREGLATVETSLREMVTLADDVRGLSQRIEGLNARMRDIFEIASVVTYVADRSQRLADRAAVKTAGGGGAQDFGETVSEMRQHAEEARRASGQVKGILSEVHKAMISAMTAAAAGVRRAEQGAQVAAGTGDAIRKLATALRESSQAAREIAAVAQQQDHGIDQVLVAMNEIFLATQETVSSTQTVAVEARALNDLASGLKRAVEA